MPTQTAVDRITYGPVHLDVADATRSLEFWRDVVGLHELGADGVAVALGAGGRPLVVLHPGAERPVQRGHAGLYHLALHLPSLTEFARVVGRVAAHRVAQAPTDHVFSMASYLDDPDRITLELTLETPERVASIDVGPHHVYLVDADGRRRAPSERLDTTPLLAELEGLDLDVPLPDDTIVGHVHLNVPDMLDAVRFYRDVVGFDEHMVMTSVGMADMSAGGRFPHRLAVNIWQGQGTTQPPPGTAGLRRFELLVEDEAALEGVRARLAATRAFSTDVGAGVEAVDPAGNTLRVDIA